MDRKQSPLEAVVIGRGMLAGAVFSALAGCLPDFGGPNYDDLVRLAGQGSAAELTKALDGADPSKVAALRFGLGLGIVHAAVGNRGNPGAVAQVARAGGDINLQDEEGRTPLHLAIDADLDGVARQLMDLGADLSLENQSGFSPKSFCDATLRGLPDHKTCLIVVSRAP